MTAAQLAALRILENTPPERITTHHRNFLAESSYARRYNGQIPQEIIDEYVRLRKLNLKYADLRERLGVGAQTIRRLRIITTGLHNDTNGAGANVPTGAVHGEGGASAGQSSLPEIPCFLSGADRRKAV